MLEIELIKCVTTVCPINLFYYDERSNLQEVEGQCENFEFLPDDEKIKKLRLKCKKHQGACIFEDSDYFYFGFLELNNNGFIILGPCCNDTNSAKIKFQFQGIYQISSQGIQISNISKAQLSSMIVILAKIIDDKKLSALNIIHEKQDIPFAVDRSVDEYRVKISEEDLYRFGADEEEKIDEMISEGKEDELYMQIEKGHPRNFDKIGDLADREYKKLEYAFVTALCIARRAAIKGGMNYVRACDISDVYLKRLERCSDVQDIIKLLTSMQKYYVHEVYLIKKRNEQNIYVEFCKNEICRNITKHLNRNDLAKKLGVSPGYLSNLFKKETGMTLMEFSTDAKMQSSANMLKFSDVPITDIATRFGYASAGRFSIVFKRKFGITPSEYRKVNKNILT